MGRGKEGRVEVRKMEMYNLRWLLDHWELVEVVVAVVMLSTLIKKLVPVD